MKNYRFIPAVLFCAAALSLASGCFNPTAADPRPQMEPGQGMLIVSLGGNNVQPSLGARTMLPRDPQFTRYELEFFNSDKITPSAQPSHSFTNSSIQLQLPAGPSPGTTYYIRANGYNGDVLVARSEVEEITLIDQQLKTVNFTLKPYMGEIDGVLEYSLSWDGLSRMPARAELKIEHYGDHDGNSGTDFEWYTIPPSLIPGTLTQNGPGTILLYSRDRALSQLTGSLSLPPGAYKLTVSVTMDEGVPPVSRTDAAHIYSTLTTPAAFHYGGGDLLLSNVSPDSGAAFITGFTFTETPNATTVIGSEPGADGTRLIMIMAPGKKVDNTPLNLADLTPIVTCAPGSSIISPLPATVLPDMSTGLPRPQYTHGEIDFTNPTIWTAQAKNGAIQRYTVVVTKAPSTSTEKRITYFFFKDYGNYPGIIDADSHTIHVILPHGTSVDSSHLLTPIISIIGKTVIRRDGSTDVPVGPFDFSSSSSSGSPTTYRVYAEDGTFQDYGVTVDVAANTEKIITKFVIDGYPGVSAVIDDDADDGGPGEEGSITAVLPYGVSLTNLTPLIQYRGVKLDPASGTARNFSASVYYTVTAQNTSTKTYKVTLTNEAASTNTGIFDFVITNYSNCKVVIGQKPRQDGKIPIVIQVPYGTNETNLIPAITLKSPYAKIQRVISGTPQSGPASGVPIPFVNQEAIYRVTAQDTTTIQDYVVVVSQDVQYYYVNGTTGSDTWPDIYNGGSETQPFKTLAYAVYRASRPESTVNKIFVTGELNNTTEGEAWEEASVPWPAGFRSSGSTSGSVITIDGTGNKTITVTGTGNNATLRGSSGKRVLSVTGGAKLVFENITVTGGDSGGNGGGFYISGNSTVKFSGGSITGNKAVSGGGVYIEDSDNAKDSEFTLMGGTISNNTATGTSAALDTMGGGGGVYVKGNALFWLAGGTVSTNTATRGAGGGVLVNGNPNHDPDGAGGNDSHEDGFLMSGGTISGNRAPAGVYPHGGGGVYVLRGAFEMLGGSITGNHSNRQGGGVFVHWGDGTRQPRFTASGNSLITGNEGVGSSKAICNRGRTELIGSAQADTVYVWDYDDAAITDQSFTLGGNARIGGLVLAYSEDNKNYLTIATAGITGSDQICRIDLEGHLTGGLFKDFTPDSDWVGKQLIKDTGSTLASLVSGKRIVLGTFTGSKTIYLTDYSIEVSGAVGRLKH